VSERYPGYDVLAKRHSPSWNEQTRRVLDERLAIDPNHHEFLTDAEWLTLRAVCAQIVPQPPSRERPVPVAAMIDQKLRTDSRDGHRHWQLPPLREAWRLGLQALDAEAVKRHGKRFHELESGQQVELLTAIQEGRAHESAWGGMPAAVFFHNRLLHDVVAAYYAHPIAWNEIGFGGPASPRGYVRLNYDRRDPWEASEARPGREEQARRENARVGGSGL
jgi:hypothetical protein